VFPLKSLGIFAQSRVYIGSPMDPFLTSVHQMYGIILYGTLNLYSLYSLPSSGSLTIILSWILCELTPA